MKVSNTSYIVIERAYAVLQRRYLLFSGRARQLSERKTRRDITSE